MSHNRLLVPGGDRYVRSIKAQQEDLGGVVAMVATVEPVFA